MTPLRPVLTRRHYTLLTAAFLLFVLYGSLVPLSTRSLSWGEAVERYTRAIARGVRLESRSDWAANVMLFVPLGFVAAGAVAADRRRPAAVLALVPAMAALSAGIEFLQLWFPDRNTNVNDVAAETLGGLIGVTGWLLFGQAATDRFRAAWAGLGPGDWAAKALPAYLLFVVIAHGMPFDLTLSPWQIKHKYDRGMEPDAEIEGYPRVALAPVPKLAAEKTLLNIAYFLPVGALLARLPGRRWRDPEATGRVLAAGFAIAGAVECVQLIVLSAGTYASDVICGGIIVLAGWWLTILPRPIPARAWVAAALAWAVALALTFWAPFDVDPGRLAARAGGANWVPFADYFAGDYVGAFNRMLNKAVLFAPLGFAVCRARRMPALTGCLVGAAVSAAVELGQVFTTDHRASVSDVILGTVGAGVGALVAARVAAAPAPEPAPAPTAGRNVFYDGVR